MSSPGPHPPFNTFNINLEMKDLNFLMANVLLQIFATLFVLLAATTPSVSEERDAKLRDQLSDIQIYNDLATILLNGDGTLFAQVKPLDSK